MTEVVKGGAMTIEQLREEIAGLLERWTGCANYSRQSALRDAGYILKAFKQVGGVLVMEGESPKLFQVFGIRHNWIVWAINAEMAIHKLLEDEPDASWEFPWDKKGNVDIKKASEYCEEIPLAGYKRVIELP